MVYEVGLIQRDIENVGFLNTTAKFEIERDIERKKYSVVPRHYFDSGLVKIFVQNCLFF